MPRFTEVEDRIIKKYISNPDLSDSLADIHKAMESIWRSDVRIVKNYTDHGVKHSIRIAGFVEKLLEVNPNVKFSEQEIYLLLAGVYLHDIGMQCDVIKYPEIKNKAEKLGAQFDVKFAAETANDYFPEQRDAIRENHHYLSAAWIDYLYEGNDPALSNLIQSIPDDLVDDLIDICKFHSKLPINNCPDSFIHYPNNRKRMVAALLRFADELDISSTRVDLNTVKLFTIKPDNSVYWWLHNYTNIIFIDSNKIRVTVRLHPEDFESYGSFIREDYITKFKNKNQSILDVLVGYNIPVVIDYSSDVVAHKRAEIFPPEISNVFEKKLKISKFDERNKKPVIGKLRKITNESQSSEIPNHFTNFSIVKDGSELKELVVALEEGLSGTGIKITSPDFIEDKTTKKKREVDISLKGNVGSCELLVIIECRNHKQKQDVTWIEQIATKRDDIGAHKAIAVSSHGFTDTARKKAIAKNIELRTLGYIDPKEIIEWFQPTGLTIHNRRYNLLKATIIPDESLDSSQIKELNEFIKSFSGAFPRSTKFIIDSEFDDALSVDDFILGNMNKLFEILKPSEEKITTQAILTPQPQNKEASLFVATSNKRIKIAGILVRLEVWLEVKESKIASVSSYDNEETSFVQIVLFEDIDINGVKKSYKIHRTPKGDTQRLDFYVKDLE